MTEAYFLKRLLLTSQVRHVLNKVPHTYVATGGSTSISFTVAGSGPFDCQWFHNKKLISGATSLTLTLSDASADDAGKYHAEVSNSLKKAKIVRSPCMSWKNQQLPSNRKMSPL